MQYLLSEEETDQLRAERETARKMPSLEALTNVVQHVACNMAEVGPSLPNGRKATDKPHGCVYIENAAGHKAWYCDDCPVRGICPLTKKLSR